MTGARAADPCLSELTARATAIDLPTYHEDITEAILRVGGDLARALGDARGCRRPADAIAVDLGRELGNLVVSALRWMHAYGLDPAECIAAAEEAQRAYLARPRREDR